ncbi:MAG: hypothetical protein ACKVU0_12130 [Saprospiraceae bacterium]
MKFLSILTIAALCAISVFSACGGDSAASKDAATETTGDQAPTTDPMANFPDPNGAPPPPTAEPAQNAAGLWHYTCPKGCKGGAGSAVACATCGTTLVHSQTYHGAPGAPPPGNPATTTPTATPGAPGASTVTMPAPTKNEPPQNAAGVWHYKCPGGCAGGGGSAIACGKCGKTMEHNPAYHQ